MPNRLKWKWEEPRTLSPRDMALAVDLCLKHNNSCQKLLEVGVFKGAFMNTLLMNCPNWTAVGIDPYPGHPETRELFKENARSLGLTEKIDLFNDFEEFQSKKVSLSTSEMIGRFGLIHIDGEHSEEAVYRDLNESFKYLASDGILVIDDIFHTAFPGIASAVYRFIHSNSLVPFLLSGDKMWLCFPEFYEKFSEATRFILNDRQIAFNSDYLDVYEQSNSIKGYSQIIIKHEKEYYEIFRKYNHIPLSRYELRMKIHEVIDFVLPGFVVTVLRKVLNTLRKARNR